MRSYGQFCPVAKTAEILCQRWNTLIIRDLAWGSTRFSQLKRGVPLMSPTLLSQRLKDLEHEGVIERRKESKGRRHTYHLTEAGREFAPIIEAMGVWGRRWTRRELKPDEIDADLLLWGLEGSARFDAFHRVPTLIRIELTDQPEHRRLWWFLNDDGRCQLCIHEPGHEIDLYLSSTTENLVHVYLGDIPISHALEDGRLEAIGTRKDIARLPDWLNLSALSKIPSMRQDCREP